MSQLYIDEAITKRMQDLGVTFSATAGESNLGKQLLLTGPSAATGTFGMGAADNAGAYDVKIVNASHGQGSTYTAWDSGKATAFLAYTASAAWGIVGPVGVGGAGQAVQLTGGAGATDEAGGAVTVTGGAGVGTGTGGAASLTGGASAGASGTAGAATVDAGAATGGTGAAVNIGTTHATGVTIGKTAGTNTINGTTNVVNTLQLAGTSMSATAAQLNSVTRFPGAHATGVVDFNDVGEAAMTVTIDGVAYLEADAEDLPNGTWTNGASAADSATSLAAAINGDTRNGGSAFTAIVSAAGDSVILVADAVGTAGNVTITTDSAGNCTVENATGGLAAAIKQMSIISRVVTAQDILAGEVTIPLPFAPTDWAVTHRDTNGDPNTTTWRATVQTSPNRIRVASNGATALVAGDVVTVIAME